MIWEYNALLSANSNELKSYFDNRGKTRACIFCSTGLENISRDSASVHKATPEWNDPNAHHDTSTNVDVCPSCGWWTIKHKEFYCDSEGGDSIVRAGWGALKELSVTDASVSIKELRLYLTAKYNERFNLNPRKYEEIVADVFSDFGYDLVLTSYSGDDGIDIIILADSSNDYLGVQVKRYKNKIGAEQIRTLAGSLKLGGMTKGVFVTTSNFTKGALNTTARYESIGVPINLYDSNKFYDCLRITNRTIYKNIHDESAPFFEFKNNPETLPEIHRGYANYLG